MDIIVQLQGGLGNQLFQYATGKALALKHRANLLLDSTWFARTYNDVTPRELLAFNLNIQAGQLPLTKPTLSPKRIRRLIQSLYPINPYIYKENLPYQFDLNLLKPPPFKKQNLHIMGYWQSFRYFEHIRSTLKQEVTPRNPLNHHYHNYLEKIQSTNSAMIHIRRGDYITLNSAAKVHGFIGLEYYQEGMLRLLSKNPKTQFFVFSDDIIWAKKFLPHQDCLTLIESSRDITAPVQELELMTHCQNHLIANSSLSWWGAWLKKHSGGTTICPKRWTNNLNMSWDDLIPAEWTQI
ncbi:alpha-1,2-fucosyltransferase [Polynucleobacter sp. AP-Feld-500C-C5]|uniref:alpha-1,2-fucosyltransferase n=1 Tax=Polynucleobacter sp. AP-Feld-500C-C5 TaxID=2576924 RepID=UPI001C0AE4C6|nr:alpha-1,2-fucosyltransferase [Polynucleobacter sp. AP-Feld-500C-C5]MBU3632789.1 alpha-1,2-fucosyltransferase [Polynucleobacter sp. AP-Feld-500C-C5]